MGKKQNKQKPWKPCWSRCDSSSLFLAILFPVTLGEISAVCRCTVRNKAFYTSDFINTFPGTRGEHLSDLSRVPPSQGIRGHPGSSITLIQSTLPTSLLSFPVKPDLWYGLDLCVDDDEDHGGSSGPELLLCLPLISCRFSQVSPILLHKSVPAGKRPPNISRVAVFVKVFRCFLNLEACWANLKKKTLSYPSVWTCFW